MKINFLEEIVKSTPRKTKRYAKRDVSFLGEETPLQPKTQQTTLNQNLKLWELLLFFLVSLLTVLIFASKAFYLQIVKGEENLALSDGNRIRVSTIQAERGMVFDRNGTVLVQNKPAFGVELNTSVCNTGNPKFSCFNIVENLKKYVKLNDEFVLEMLNSGRVNVILAQNLTKEEILPLEANLSSFPGVSVSVTPMRDYVFREKFAHLIGYVGFGESFYPSVVGKSGLEESYDGSISGGDGSKIIQVDSSGKSFKVLSERKSFSGSDVVLYVDAGLQELAYDLLRRRVEDDEEGAAARGGAIVAQDPKTGGILALVSYPSFDPNKLSSGTISTSEFEKLISNPSFPFFNRAISATYPPASTFKMVIAAAALEEGVVGEYFEVNDIGFIKAGGSTFRNWKLDGHGKVDMRRALQVSNDTYFYTVGGKIGISKLFEWASEFGFGSKTGVDIGGEVSGFVPNGEAREWYLGDTYITSIGQGDLLATPLQVNNATLYFANGGYLFKPLIVRSIEGRGDSEVEVLAQNFIDTKTYNVVREGLKLAVEPGGTGYPLFNYSFEGQEIELAGKTGTAEFGGPDDEKTHAWFTVFGPFDDPSIVLTVFLEEGGSGSADAAPIAKELLDYWFSENL